MSARLSIRFHVPRPALAAHVTSFYLIDCPDGVDDWLHPEWANIRFAPTGDWHWGVGAAAPRRMAAASLFGPTSRAAHIVGGTGGCVIGVGLTPLGWTQLVRKPASRYADSALALDELFPEAGQLHQRLCDTADDGARVAALELWLTTRLATQAADLQVERLHRALVLGDISTVPAFASDVCVSERTLERICPRLFGFAPKKLLRRQRFLRSLDKLQRNPGMRFTDSLDDSSYTDQSHFVREFKAHMGMNPSLYFAQPRPLLQAAARARAEMLGQTLQGLHAPPEPRRS